jgi:predicted TIM-barrel fold metal-dependent hydrolase
MWTNSKEKYPWRDQLAQLKILLEMYGASRIMWGSDWSFSLRHTPYPQALSFLRNEADFLSREELTWIMSGTTMRLWKFAEATQKAARGADLRVSVG